ncbi:hypothetical protein [uncultured Sulfitobacter sp.]|jgi:hypothetical protein|uniref:hypothetical protein n=1 Tax=Sulfitobacter sp. SH22 TaxID=3421172 RepID=UPI0025CC6B00|nr:hypothetical protein [uncultured Sulfitobacter sp.]
MKAQQFAKQYHKHWEFSQILQGLDDLRGFARHSHANKTGAKAVYDDFFDGVDAPNYRHLDMPL